MTRRWHVVVVLLLAVVMVAAACGGGGANTGGGGAPSDTPGQAGGSDGVGEGGSGTGGDDDDITTPLDEPVTVKMAWAKVVNLAPQYILPEIAAKYNVNIELVEFRRFADMRTALAAEQVDFSTFGPQDISLGLNQGVDNLIGVAGIGVGNDCMMVRSGVEVQDWDDLVGLRIGVGAGSISWLKFAASVDEHGVDYQGLDVIGVQGGAQEYVNAIRQADIDVAVVWEPNCAAAVHSGDAEYPPFSHNESELVGGTFGVFATNTTFLNSRPNVVQRIVLAWVEAIETLATDRERWYDVAQEYSGLDREVVELAITGSRSELDYRVPVAQIESLTQYMYEQGVIPNDVTGEVAAHYDLSFLARATGKTEQDLGAK